MYRRKKRTYKRRATRARRVRRLPSSGVGASKIVKLRYVDTFTLASAVAGVAHAKVFRANSIQDPDYSGIGHQPLGHDEWVPFYNHYNVIGSKITARFISEAESGSAAAAHCGIMLKDNVTLVTDPLSLLEQANSRYNIVTSANAQQASKNIVKTFSCKKFFGIKDVGDNRTVVGASFGSIPVEEAYFHVFVSPIQTGTSVANQSVIVTIDYIVQLTERKTLIRS